MFCVVLKHFLCAEFDQIVCILVILLERYRFCCCLLMPHLSILLNSYCCYSEFCQQVSNIEVENLIESFPWCVISFDLETYIFHVFFFKFRNEFFTDELVYGVTATVQMCKPQPKSWKHLGPGHPGGIGEAGCVTVWLSRTGIKLPA